jgi:hypothetical protein
MGANSEVQLAVEERSQFVKGTCEFYNDTAKKSKVARYQVGIVLISTEQTQIR